MSIAHLHLVCGLIAAGKSTRAAALACEHDALLLSEDDWLARLYPDEIRSVADYVRCAARLREVLGPLLRQVLAKGMPVVLDWPANTREARAWFRDLAQAAGVPCSLHYLAVDAALCRARLHARNAQGTHAFAATDAEFDLISRHFQAPSADEGLQIVRHEA